MSEPKKVMPILIVKTGTVSQEHIARAETLGFILMVESDDPDSARFMQPPPDSTLGAQALAAIALMRWVTYQDNEAKFSKSSLMDFFLKALMDDNKVRRIAPVKP